MSVVSNVESSSKAIIKPKVKFVQDVDDNQSIDSEIQNDLKTIQPKFPPLLKSKTLGHQASIRGQLKSNK